MELMLAQLLMLIPGSRLKGDAGIWEGARSGQLTPANQRGIACHVISCLAIKRERKKYEEVSCLSLGN